MKHLYLAAAVLFLTACAGSETTAPVTSDGLLPPAEAPGGTSAEPSLATESFLAPDASGNVAQPAPLDANLATPVDTSSSGSLGSAGETAGLSTPTPPEPPSVPLPEPTAAPSAGHATAAAADQPALSPVVPGSGTGPTARSVREEYREYRDRIETRAANESAIEDRALFPHEDGAFQLSIDYLPSALDGLDFDPGVRVATPSTQGGMLGLSYFPLRSLSWGRLGLGLQGGAYWSKYEYRNAAAAKDESSHKHSARSYGGKLQYEFQYFLGQLFVPFVQYGYDRVSLLGFDRAGAGYILPKRSIGSTFYGGGLQLNLNRLEPSSSSKALVSSGVRKFYLAYTFQQRKYETESGTSHVLGLRFEY